MAEPRDWRFIAHIERGLAPPAQVHLGVLEDAMQDLQELTGTNARQPED